MRRRVAILIVLVASLRPAITCGETFPGEDELVRRLKHNDLTTYLDLKVLMNPYQMKQYLTLSSSRARSNWVERFWMEIDPTPTTEVNERRIEHEKRLSIARGQFPSRKVPGWDARGEVVVRYGLPDTRTIMQGDVTPNSLILPKEVWSFAEPPMVITFEDLNLRGEYVYAVEPGDWWNVPPGPNNVPDNIDYTYPMWHYVMWREDVDLSVLVKQYHAEDQPLAKDELREALENTPAIYDCDREQKWLPVYFDITSFRGGNRQLRTEVHFEVPANGVQLVPTGNERAAEVEFKIVVRDFNMKEVAAASDVMTATVTRDSLSGSKLLPGQITLPLSPGYYRVGLEACDRNSNRRAAFRTNLELASLDGSPAVSDIEFASSVQETEDNPRFAKGSLQVVPHPLRAYRIPSPIDLYFEIYGLDMDRNDIAYYRIEYRIEALEKRRWGPVLQDVPTNISSSFETSGYGSMQPQRLSIATENLWEGPFKLTVVVTDRRTFRTATRSAKFSILE